MNKYAIATGLILFLFPMTGCAAKKASEKKSAQKRSKNKAVDAQRKYQQHLWNKHFEAEEKKFNDSLVVHHHFSHQAPSTATHFVWTYNV